jgi:hypothetical protein
MRGPHALKKPINPPKEIDRRSAEKNQLASFKSTQYSPVVKKNTLLISVRMDFCCLEKSMEPSTRGVVHRSPWDTFRILNLWDLQPEAIQAESSAERDFAHCAALFNYTQRLAFQPLEDSQHLLRQAEGRLNEGSRSSIVATNHPLRQKRLAERSLHTHLYAKGAFNTRERGIAVSLLADKNSSFPIGDLAASLTTSLHAACHRRLQLSTDVHFEDAGTVTLPADDHQGKNKSARFAGWLSV